MKTLDHSLSEPAHNLACDEILLDEVNGGRRGPVLRFWEFTSHFAVVGYGNSIERECDTEACRRLGIPILRRISGGGTVLQGPGCLNYSLVMRIDPGDATRSIGGTNCLIMSAHREALSRVLGQAIQVQGHTDLTLGGVKFSGNAQRRRRSALLFHGTFLLEFDLSLLGRALRFPSSAPPHRDGRSHDAFCRNLPLAAWPLRAALGRAWQTVGQAEAPDTNAIRDLVKRKYGNPEWIHRRP
jgi:lipoate-protein ligase A